MMLLIDWGNSSLKYMIMMEKPVTLRGAVELTNAEVNRCNSPEQLIDQLGSRYLKTNQHRSVKWQKAYISSVRDEQDNKNLARLLDGISFSGVFTQSEKSKGMLKNSYSVAESLGVDRWMVMIAGHSSQQITGIIDIGSAITLDIVSSTGEHLGGHIVPGENLIKNSLLNTANVTAEQSNQIIRELELGKDTQQCVNFGIDQMIYAYLSSTIQQASKQFKVTRWLLTGGNSEYWVKRLNKDFCGEESIVIEWKPFLVFEGLIKNHHLSD